MLGDNRSLEWFGLERAGCLMAVSIAVPLLLVLAFFLGRGEGDWVVGANKAYRLADVKF